MDLTTATPAEIDMALAAIYDREQEALVRLSRTMTDIHHAADHRRLYGSRGAQWNGTFEDALAKVTAKAESNEVDYRVSEAQRRLSSYEEAVGTVRAIRAEASPLNAEFRRRGGWTRAFLAKASNGHVHNGMDCSTCNNGFEPTQFAWFPEYSGQPEAEIVADAGERACTTCYPTAPVYVLSRPTKFFSDEEKAAAVAREERAAKKAAADALKVIVTDFPTRKIRPERIEPAVKEFKTLRAAMQAAVDARYEICRSIAPSEYFQNKKIEETAKAEAIERAIAAKTGRTVEDVQAETTAKAEKKFAKNW